MDNSIKEAREKRNISQEKLADKAGISRTHLSEIENNKVNPTLKVAFAIAHALGLKVNQIFFADFVKHKQQRSE